MRTRYAVIGLGFRARLYTYGLLGSHAAHGELVAFCDTNQARMDLANRELAQHRGASPIPTYTADRFAEMLKAERVDTLIVTTIDRTHDRYICQAMELGCDVISEKPMTIDAERCQRILDTVATTGRRLRVAFNYRYAPRNSRVKELLMGGAIGDVLSVHFEWLLDTNHGADYFRRWHRDKRNSGGLMVHKATHHFDLVNWWLGSRPRTVFGMGRLAYYGRDNAEQRGVARFYDRATGNPAAAGDPFALHLDRNPGLKAMYLDAEHLDGYRRDQSVFGDGISIEDDMAVMARYQSGATMTYHLTAYAPWEGWRIMFNGSRGRLEYEVEESLVARNADAVAPPPLPGGEPWTSAETERILVRPHWGEPLRMPLDSSDGGHGGGDERLLDDLFAPGKPDPLGRAADHVDGAWSILTGIAANASFASGLPVEVESLVSFPTAR